MNPLGRKGRIAPTAQHRVKSRKKGWHQLSQCEYHKCVNGDKMISADSILVASNQQVEKEFYVSGSDRAGAASEIEAAAMMVPGVKSTHLSPATRRLLVAADTPGFDFSKVEEAITRLGYSVGLESSGRPLRLRVEGMCCANESEMLRKKLKSINGVDKIEINLVSQQADLSYDPALTSVQSIIKAIAETGLKSSPVRSVEEKPAKTWRERIQIISLSICGTLVVIALLMELLHFPQGSTQIVWGAAILVGIYFPAKMGIMGLRTLTLNIRMLMVVGAIGAILLGLWEEAAILVFVYSLGDVLETYAVDRARGAVRALVELAPKEALIRRDGCEVTLPVSEIKVGDVAIVRPGVKVPVDGTVISGTSFIDQSTITGESVPVEKKQGDEVFAGTINQKGSVEVSVAKASNDTTLVKIIHAVEEAQAKKTTYQRFAEKFSKYYTPAMFLLGVAVATVPPAFFGADLESSIYRGLTVFVVSCSCGLALSVPVGIVSSTAKAARNGILFRGGAYIESAQSVRAIAFDKTGTLTIGRPSVTDIVVTAGYSEEEILAIVGAIESRSEHPIAEAIVRRARENGPLDLEHMEHFESISGLGVMAWMNGTEYYLGDPRLFQKMGVPLAGAQDVISRLQKEGKTAVVLGSREGAVGVIAVADRIRPEVPQVIADLKRSGLRVVMLTGDNEEAAKAIASSVGVDEYLAQLLPEAKVDALKKLKEKYGHVAMVGDGVNDAPALATADIGIAMGAAGTDIAIETGDIVLMSDDLSKLPFMLKLSKRATRNIKQNIGASLAIISFLIPAALLGFLSLTLGLFINESGALLVILNALRLLR